MATKSDGSSKTAANAGVFVLELFAPDQNASKPNGSIFDRQAPNEWKAKWPRNIDFLFVCSGFCAGLGNLWRFPSVALQFGGGSFLIAYLIVLLIIGFPIFYLEAVLGQFVSRAGARMFDCVPLLRGVGYGQMFLSSIVASYYSGMTAVAAKFLTSSFSFTLPWSICPDENNNYCRGFRNITGRTNSSLKPLNAEVYYRQDVIPEVQKESSFESFISNYDLIIYLCICWVVVTLIVEKGLRVLSQLGGFLLFAFLSVCLMFVSQVLLLPGATEGVRHFLTADWKLFAGTEIWYAALVQVFFSLGICFGPMAMYSSFNRFSYNMFTDILFAVVINILIAFTAGCTIFAVVGNVVESSHIKFEDFSSRSNDSTFILLSEVVTKFVYLPQVTSAILFFLYCLLGIASVSAFEFVIVQIIRDEFFIKKTLKTNVFVSTGIFLVSLIYLAPVGEHLTMLLDSHGIPFAIGFLSILELIALTWIYGVKRICDDIEYMFGFRTRFLWRMLWSGLPGIIIALFVAHLIYSGIVLDLSSSGSLSPRVDGYSIGCIAIIFVAFIISFWSIYVLLRQPKQKFWQRLKQASLPDSNWGPADSSLLLNYKYFILKKDNTST